MGLAENLLGGGLGTLLREFHLVGSVMGGGLVPGLFERVDETVESVLEVLGLVNGNGGH